MKSWKIGVAAGLAAAVLGTGAFAVAQPSGQRSDRPDGDRRARVAHAAVHADVIAVGRDEEVRNLVMDLGRVSAIDAQSRTFELHRRDGVDVRVRVADDTKIGREGEPAQFTDIHVGDTVRALAERTSGDMHWLAVRIVEPKAGA